MIADFLLPMHFTNEYYSNRRLPADPSRCDSLPLLIDAPTSTSPGIPHVSPLFENKTPLRKCGARPAVAAPLGEPFASIHNKPRLQGQRMGNAEVIRTDLLHGLVDLP